jgi:hypothetical protein
VSDFALTYLSFGAGVQSTALLVCSNLGLHSVPRADVAIFADTGYEPQYVYDQLETMRKWSKIPVEVVTRKDQSRRGSYAAVIPAFTSRDGKKAILKRQCTSNWKIEPLEAEARRLLGYKPRQRIKKQARCLIGISLDEAHRMKPNRQRWITSEWPLVDARLRRSDCLKIVADAGLPKPERSACYFCPFHSIAEWRFLRDKHPEEFAKAVEYDKAIRNSTRGGVALPVYLHSQLIPLGDVVFDRPERPLFANMDHQVTMGQMVQMVEEADAFGNECEGVCGV